MLPVVASAGAEVAVPSCAEVAGVFSCAETFSEVEREASSAGEASCGMVFSGSRAVSAEAVAVSAIPSLSGATAVSRLPGTSHHISRP